MDENDPRKRDICRVLLRSVATEIQGVILTQVMQEFFVTATRKLGAEPSVVKDILRSFEKFEIVIINPELIHVAIDVAVNCLSGIL